MRLLSCRIENFGKLKDLSLKFSQGCNVIRQDNGWGKSTLAAFIKVMLYGFEEEKSRDGLKNERKRYRPWQGGVYGGRLEFEAGGESYVLTRTFGAKEKEDSFSLRKKDTNLECHDFSAAVGEELFSLDRASFCRTVFISQNDCGTVATDAVNAKIGNLTEATDDINNYEKVNQRFLNLINQMSPSRKTGSLYKDKEEIARLEQRIRAGSSVDQAIETLYGRLRERQGEQDALKEEQALLTEKQQKIAAYKDIQVKQEAYKNLCREYEKRKEQAQEARSRFPAEVPQRQALEEAAARSAELSAAGEAVRIHAMSEEEKQRERDLSELFREGCPSQETLDEQEACLRSMQELKVALAQSSLSEEEAQRLRDGQRRFSGGVPELSEFDRIISGWNGCVERKNTLEQKKLTYETLKDLSAAGAAGKRKRAGSLAPGAAFLVLGAGLLFLGIWLAAMGGKSLPGLAAGAAGLAAAAAGALFLLRKKREERKAASQAPESPGGSLERMGLQIAEDEAFAQKVGKEAKDFLERYGIAWERESEILDRLYDLKAYVREYITLSEKSRAGEQEMQRERYRELAEGLRAFLTKYSQGETPEESGFAAELAKVRQAAGEYGALKKKSGDLEQAQQAYQKLAGSLRAFLQGLSITPERELQAQLMRLKDQLYSYESGMWEFQLAKERKEAFEESENMEEILGHEPVEDPQALRETTGRLEEIAGRLEQVCAYVADEKRQLDELREESDRIAEEAERLEALKEAYRDGCRKYELIRKTRELLEQAKISLTARYTEPVRKSLARYYEILSGESAGRLLVDANANVTVDELGMQREPRFFSAGYQDMIGVCMRMALVDAMYRAEKPFLILDDPFANLDGEKLDGALQFLGQVSGEYQILYFTCHESRAPGIAGKGKAGP